MAKSELTPAQILERHKTDIAGFQKLFGGAEPKELSPKEALAQKIERVRAHAEYIYTEPGFNQSDVRALAGCVAQLAEVVAQMAGKVE